jgi:hypothetical protein
MSRDCFTFTLLHVLCCYMQFMFGCMATLVAALRILFAFLVSPVRFMFTVRYTLFGLIVVNCYRQRLKVEESGA